MRGSRPCAGGGLGDGAADYVGGGSSICDEVEIVQAYVMKWRWFKHMR